MNKTKPWIETWAIGHNGVHVAKNRHEEVVQTDSGVYLRDTGVHWDSEVDHETHPDMRLIAAAPALVRALLVAEYADTSDGEYTARCGVCEWGGYDGKYHRPDCILDAALTDAGLPPLLRDAARAEIKRMAK